MDLLFKHETRYDNLTIKEISLFLIIHPLVQCKKLLVVLLEKTFEKAV